ncbi:SDR family NAD(P)-dependent oxidoreductase [Streptomyces sp. NPDC102274]|uniref:SDR family NAD(P)-dependent oxidoreductase n=1 Tax=Streptomyces sp. NPDC102274 TaxID=3366151 RepID=UPI00380EF3DA
MDIQGKTALVAGGTSGLGLGVVRDLAARGANVMVLGRRAELAAQIAADLGNAIGVGADIADSEAAAIEAAVERFGGIHINVNTAGVIDTVRLVADNGEPTDVAAFIRVVDTNLVGTFNVMSQSAAVMLRNEPDADGERGVIVNTSSDAAYDGTTGMAWYSATKAALVGMTLPAAREFAGRGIRVNTIVAGGFDTPIFDGYTTDDAIAEQVTLFVNPRRLGRPEEFAAFAAHIVENGYFNAAAPRLDAGYRIPL